MDDMVFQYNNHNSIYVLNANYTSYEQQIPHFGVINSMQQQQTTRNERKNSKFQKIEESAKSLQQKLKILEKEHFDGITTDGIGNPIASLMSSATCSPSAAVIQKLINCNNNVGNTFIANANANSSSSTEKVKDYAEAFEAVSINSNRNANTSCNPRSNSKLSTAMIGNCNSAKKKCNTSSIKSTLIAKKTKFWKFLEEEKARTQEQDISNGNLTTTSNCEQCKSTTCQTYFRSPGQTPYNEVANHESLSYAIERSTVPSTKTNEPQRQQQQRQQKVNNWSGNHDKSNNQLKQQQKSSYELYREAAELLGLSCTLCDNCRCLDCQSGYFDCDDSDSYSDFSTMDDDDYGFEESLTVTAHEMALIMHASAENKCMTNELSTLGSIATSSVHCEQVSRTTADITSSNYDVETEEATNDMHDMSACCCRNGNYIMEPHTNELNDTNNDSGFQARTISSRQGNGEIASMDLMTLERTASSGALINTMNSMTREESQEQQQQQPQPQQQCQQNLSHHQQHQKHLPESNEVENCASFNSLNLLDTKETTDDASISTNDKTVAKIKKQKA